MLIVWLNNPYKLKFSFLEFHCSIMTNLSGENSCCIYWLQVKQRKRKEVQTK